ncbi:MAG: hypothetical protein AB7K09_14350 [Planctomycetota bacterium]
MHASRLTAMLVALLVSALIMACASNPPASNTGGNSSSNGGGVLANASGADVGMPSWVFNPPDEPGVWYAVGSSTYKSITQMQRAMQTASTEARRKLADSVRVRVEGCTKSYSRQILTAGGDISEESMSQDVTRVVSVTILEGATITQQDFWANKDGTNTCYAQARITAADVAKSLQETLQKYPNIPPYDQIERDLMQGVTTDPRESNLPGMTGNNAGPAPTNNNNPGSMVEANANRGNNQPTMNGGTNQPGMNTGNSNQPRMNAGNGNQPRWTPGGNNGGGNTSGGPSEVDPDRARRWQMQRDDPEYPKGVYLLGVGQGTSQAQAEASARADLVAQLEVKIEGVTTVWSSSEMKIKGSKLDINEVVRATDTVTSTVRQTIRGSIVGGMARVDGNWVVLVVLKIADWLRETGARIDQLEREIKDALNSAQRSIASGYHLAAIRTLGDAWRNAREAIALVGLWNVFGKPARTAAYTLAMIDEMILDAGRNTTLCFRVKAVMEFADGRKEESGESDLVDAITQRLQQDRTGLTLRTPSSTLQQMSVEQIGSAGREQLAQLLPDTTLLVHGTITTRFNGRVVDGRFAKYTTGWDLTILNVRTGQALRLGNSAGVASTGTDDRVAAAGSQSKAAFAIAQAVAEKLRGR